MAETDKLFAGSIPKFYEEFLVPMIFRPYAEDLARRASAHNPSNVLETAAGTGIVTRALAARLDPSARYTVTDLNQPMLDVARERQGMIRASPGSRRMRFRCRSPMLRSMRSAASSARCSSPIA